MIRIYKLSSTLAEKFYDIMVPEPCDFLVYPNDKTIYLQSGHTVRYDLIPADKNSVKFEVLNDPRADEASK